MTRTAGDPSGPRPRVERAIDDLSAVLRLRTYIAPPVWGELNLTILQLQLLLKLRRFGPVPMHRIAEWLSSRNASATGVVDRLADHGLVERARVPHDRRVVEARLTDEGTRLIDEVLGIRRDGFRAVLAALSDDELDALHRLLTRVVEAAEGIDPPIAAEESAANHSSPGPTKRRSPAGQ